MLEQAVGTRKLSRPEFIALAAAIMALNSIAIDVMLPALPYMGRDLGVSDENEQQLVVSAYMVGFGAAQIVFGPITDRFGRRAPLFFGIGLYLVCTLIATFIPNFWVLLGFRFIQGIGAAATRVVAMSAIRDRYSGREMASIMSLVFMTFMVIPIIAPGVGQVILIGFKWHYIFLFMTALAGVIGVWAWFRLPETLRPEYRRPLSLKVIGEGFRVVFTNRSAIFYGLNGMFLFGAMFGFIICTPQIFVDYYGLGALFPVAFAFVAAFMSLAQFANSQIVKRFGTRRVSHLSVFAYIACAVTLAVMSIGHPPFWAFYAVLMVLQFFFAWASSNMNSLSMEPLGAVAGTAAAVFGFMQTVGGAIIGTFIGQQYNGTLTPNALAWTSMGILVLLSTLIAERGRLFGISTEYKQVPAVAE